MIKDKIFEKSIENGKLKVELLNEGYGMELGIRRNGYQTSCCGVNDDLIDMLIKLLSDYKSEKANG